MRTRAREIHSKDYVKIRVHEAGTEIVTWVWVPKNLFEKLVGNSLLYTSGDIRAWLRKTGVVTPMYIRSFCWQIVKQLLGNDLAISLQGKIRELKKYTTAMSYDDLAYQFDEKYGVWKKFVDEILLYSTHDVEQSINNANKLRELYKPIMPI